MKIARFVEVLGLWFFVRAAVEHFAYDGFDWATLLVAATALAIALVARDMQYMEKE